MIALLAGLLVGAAAVRLLSRPAATPPVNNVPNWPNPAADYLPENRRVSDDQAAELRRMVTGR